MAGNLLPIIAVGAGVLLLAGGKKKRRKATYEEPPVAPGAGGAVFVAVPATLSPDHEEQLAFESIPADFDPGKAEKEVEEEIDKEPPLPPPPQKPKCRFGDIRTDKKYVCWWMKGEKLKKGKWGAEPKMHRVPKYSVARTAAFLGKRHPWMLFVPKIRFAIWCWSYRKRLYKCTKRYKLGKKRCRKWGRY